MDAEKPAPHDVIDSLPWIVGIPKPSFADDPWFARFCRVAAEIMMEYVDEQRGTENHSALE
jgi:hypothetical protein